MFQMLIFFACQIVRDFGLASHSNTELVELQRSFVSMLIASVDGKAENEKRHAMQYAGERHAINNNMQWIYNLR